MKQIFTLAVAVVLFSGITKAQTVPNGDFESWNTSPFSDLNLPWVTSNTQSITYFNKTTITKVPGQTGSAVHLETYLVGPDTVPSIIINGPVPYSQQPTSLSGYFRCNMVGHDTAWLRIEFAQNGSTVAISEQPFVGSVNTFTAFNLNLNIPLTPDSMYIIISSSNIFNGNGVMPGSWLELDGLSFNGTGITQQVPDGGFESWSSQSVDMPAGWQVNVPFISSTGVNQTTDHFTGSYSAKIVSQPFESPVQLTTGSFDDNGRSMGGLPYNLKNDTLTGYYKYTPIGNDNGMLRLHLQKSGSLVLDTGYLFSSAASWTYFQIPIHLAATPDSMRIDLMTSMAFVPKGGSTLYIDDLQLKSQKIHTSGIDDKNPEFNITAFPDPAKDQLYFRFEHIAPAAYNLKIYNLQGRLLLEKNDNTGNTNGVPLESFSEGIYFYEVAIDGSTIRNKFVKGR